MANIVPIYPDTGYNSILLKRYGGRLGHHIVLDSLKVFNAYLCTIIFNKI